MNTAHIPHPKKYPVKRWSSTGAVQRPFPLARLVWVVVAALWLAGSLPRQAAQAYTGARAALPPATIVWRDDAGVTPHRRVAWAPFNRAGGVHAFTGRALTPITFGASPVAGGAIPAGGEAAVASAFDRWSDIQGVNLSYEAVAAGGVPEISVQFDGRSAAALGHPGRTMGTARATTIVLPAEVNRSDGWVLDLNNPPASPAGMGLLGANTWDASDVFTTLVHEVGHDLGLGHKLNPPLTVMTPHNTAIGAPAGAVGRWAPDAPLPAGLPAGSLGYHNERGAPGGLPTGDDFVGLKTLYSDPAFVIAPAPAHPVPPPGAGANWHYGFQVSNNSLAGSDFRIGQFQILAPAGAVNLGSPPGWPAPAVFAAWGVNQLIVWSAPAGAPIQPGQTLLGFEFDHPMAPGAAVSAIAWLDPPPNFTSPGVGASGDLHPEPFPLDLPPAFNLALNPLENTMLQIVNGSPLFPPAPALPSDLDGDGVYDVTDVCPSTPDTGQENFDRDWAGDACDDDDDNDLLTDSGEPGAGANPLDPDTDEDGLLDGQEISAASNPVSADSDEDLVSDLTDNCRATFNPDQADNDRDGVGDLCDISIVFLPAILK